MYRSRNFPLQTKSHRVVSHILSFGTFGTEPLSWSQAATKENPPVVNHDDEETIAVLDSAFLQIYGGLTSRSVFCCTLADSNRFLVERHGVQQSLYR